MQSEGLELQVVSQRVRVAGDNMRENSLARRNMSEVEDSHERSACTVKCKVFDMAQSQSTSFAEYRREN